MDKTYLERIRLRREIMRDRASVVLGADPIVKEAVDEFYAFLVQSYLPKRFPTMFEITKDDFLYNKVTEELIPLDPPDTPLEALRMIGSLIDDDCLFLLPSEDGDGYALKGFVTCFPNGFDTSKKLNMKLRDIHIPVPGYKAKLEKSMDRFFEKLQVGKVITRANVNYGHFRPVDLTTPNTIDSGRSRLRIAYSPPVAVICTKARRCPKKQSTLIW